MAKGQKKIKRYRNIYNEKATARKVLRIVLTIALLAGAACLGWVLYEPVSKFLAGTMQLPQELISKEENVSSSQQEVSVPEVLPPVEEKRERIDLETVKGAYLPLSSLRDEDSLRRQLTDLRREGFTAIVIDAKDEKGQILYRTENQTASEIAAQASGAIDLSAVTALAEEQNLSVIARIWAFRDPLYSSLQSKAAVRYLDTEMLWLDNSKELGGQSWLNPYSELAQLYIGDLALECIHLGCAAVMLEGVQFPSGYSLELAGYGVQSKSRQQVLADFAMDMEELLKDEGGGLIWGASASSMLGLEPDSCYDGALASDVETFCPDLMPVTFSSGVRPQALINDPVQEPYETVKTVLALLREKGAEKTLLPLLQAYSSPEAGMAYTEAEVQEQIRALEEAGIEGYILFNPDGVYPLE